MTLMRVRVRRTGVVGDGRTAIGYGVGARAGAAVGGIGGLGEGAGNPRE